MLRESEEVRVEVSRGLAAVAELDGYVDQEMCAPYESDDVLTIVGEEADAPGWVEVKARKFFRTTSEMCSRREWYEEVP